jgi:hypothetical protein
MFLLFCQLYQFYHLNIVFNEAARFLSSQVAPQADSPGFFARQPAAASACCPPDYFTIIAHCLIY